MAPLLAKGLEAEAYEEYEVAIVEEEVHAPEPPPPPPRPPARSPEPAERAAARPPPPSKPESKKQEAKRGDEGETGPDFGIDGASLAAGGAGGFGVQVGETLLADPDEPSGKTTVAPPSPEPKKPKVYSIKHVTKIPSVTKRVLPEYSDQALEANIEGRVILEIVIGRDGELESVKVVAGLGHGLDEACIQAAKASEYQPAELDGRPVPCKLKIPFTFKLD